MLPSNTNTLVKFLFNIELTKFQTDALNELWIRRFPLLFGGDGELFGGDGEKDTLLAIHTLLRGVFESNKTIVLTGASYRQAKQLFNLCEEIVNCSPAMKAYFGTPSVLRDTDRCKLKLGSNTIYAMPIGVGDSLRGQRASTIIVNHCECVDGDVLTGVMAGLASGSELILAGEDSLKPFFQDMAYAYRQLIKEGSGDHAIITFPTCGSVLSSGE